MKKNQLYAVIAVLAVVVIGLGAYIWREQTKPQGVEIRLDENGISVEKN